MKRNVKPKRKSGKYIVCESCGDRIYLDYPEIQDNIEEVENTKVYYCFCGNEIVL